MSLENATPEDRKLLGVSEEIRCTVVKLLTDRVCTVITEKSSTGEFLTVFDKWIFAVLCKRAGMQPHSFSTTVVKTL